MRFFLIAIVFVHGLIHFMGFAKAFGYGNMQQLTRAVSKPEGIFWFSTAWLFIAAGVLLVMKNNSWITLSFVAIAVSQILILITWHDAKFGTIANAIILVAAIVGFATVRFEEKFTSEVKNLLQQTSASENSVLTVIDIAHLPDAVKKYLQQTGCIGKPKVKSFKVEFAGQIRKNEKSEWMPFTSIQYNFMDATTRLFFMKATMMHLTVAGFHCFKNGDAFMDIRLLSLFKVQYQSGKEMGIAETVTFFNDMCVMAPATLIDKRIKWEEVDSNKAEAIFTNNNITISAWLYFNDKGELINFISEDRFAATENNSMQRIKWSTPLKNYKTISGNNLAGSAETIYHYPEGDLHYGNFNLTNVEYNCNEFK